MNNEEYWYIAEEQIEGFNPDGPDSLTGDDGTIIVPKDTVLRLVNPDLYSIEFEMIDTGTIVALHREWLCNDVASPKYYENYFAPVKGLRKIQ